MNELVTCDFIIKLHDMAYHEQRNQYWGFKPYVASGLTAESVTLDGLRELINKIKSDTSNGLRLTYSTEANNYYEGYLIDLQQVKAQDIFANLTSDVWSHLFIEHQSFEVELAAFQKLLLGLNEGNVILESIL